MPGAPRPYAATYRLRLLTPEEPDAVYLRRLLDTSLPVCGVRKWRRVCPSAEAKRINGIKAVFQNTDEPCERCIYKGGR